MCRTVEPGTVRFDVWESPDEPNVVFLYEAYTDRDAFEAHKANEPFKRFVDEIVPSLLEPPSFVLTFTNSYTSKRRRLTSCRRTTARPPAGGQGRVRPELSTSRSDNATRTS